MFRRKYPGIKKMRILKISTGSCLSEIYKKFNTLNMFFENDIIQDCTSFNIRLVPDGKFNGTIEIKDNYLFSEIFSYFIIGRCIRLFFKSLFYILKYKINLIHSNDPFIYGFVLMLVSKITKRPFVVSIHVDHDKRNQLEKRSILPKIFYTDKFSKFCRKKVFKHSNRILPIRESMIDFIIKYGGSKDKIRIFPHGIDLSIFNKPVNYSIIDDYNLPKNKKIISFAGRVVKENYCFDLLKIAKIIGISNEDIIFLVCGDGKDLVEMKQLKSKENLDNVIFLGYVPNDIVKEIRKISFVNLSLMGGFSLIEACASGNPVISYDVEWHYELINNNISGYLVKENDINTVVEKILFLNNNSEECVKLGSFAKENAFANFSLETSHKTKKQIYEELLI